MLAFQTAWKKQGYDTVYKDTWSADEIRRAKDLLFPDMSDKELNERIYR
jgi:hypothetical protein